MKELKGCPGWEIVRKIGNGSFGNVYEIQKTDELGNVTRSAMKVISIPEENGEINAYRDDGYDEVSITRIFEERAEDIAREFRLLSKLKGNTNIVSYEDHSIVRHEDAPGWDIYIRMELLTSLPEHFAACFPNGIAEEREAIRLGIDICKALELCGRHNIIHRDIKPQNIFINENGDYKLGDFGTARTSDHTTKATKTGTYGYMAPEIYMAQPYNAGVDLYSLGLVMYWMLNERRGPFLPYPPEIPGSKQLEDALGRRIAGEALPAPRHGSKKLHKIILKACSYKEKDRYESPTAMRNELERLLSGVGNGEPVRQTPQTDDTAAGVYANTMGIFAEKAPAEDMYGKTVSTFDVPQQIKPATDRPKKRSRLPLLVAAVLVVAMALGSVITLRPWEKKIVLQEPSEQEQIADLPEQEQIDTPITAYPAGYIADGQCGESTYWVLTEGGVLTISGTGDLGDWTCSKEFCDGYAWDETAWKQEIRQVVIEEGVTEVGYGAFEECSTLESVVLPQSLKIIAQNAFQRSGVSSIDLNEGLEEIGEDAFYDCDRIESIEIPATVRKIGNGAFRHCKVLSEIKVVEDNPFYQNWLGMLLTKDGTILIQLPGGHGGVITLPEEVTCISDYAFYGCYDLIAVEIPANTLTIGKDVFYGCSSLVNIFVEEGNPYYFSHDGILYTCDQELLYWPNARTEDVVVPEGTVTIMTGAFAGCSYNLEEISLPRSLKKVQTDAFQDNSNLKNVYYAGTWEEWETITIMDFGNDYLKWSTVHTK